MTHTTDKRLISLIYKELLKIRAKIRVVIIKKKRKKIPSTGKDVEKSTFVHFWRNVT